MAEHSEKRLENFDNSSTIKKYVFRLKRRDSDAPGNGEYDTVEVLVQEKLGSSYGLYTWSSAPILAWFLYLNREFLCGKKVLELGAGVSLPGILSAFCGAEVILSDSAKLPHCLELCKKNVELNGLGEKVKVVGITWGLFLHPLTKLKDQIDLIIGSDCFYDPAVFEDLISTISYLLENNPKAKFLTTYQERSSDWSIETLLNKWDLICKEIPINELANSCEIDLPNLMQDHTIHLLEITRKQ